MDSLHKHTLTWLRDLPPVGREVQLRLHKSYTWQQQDGEWPVSYHGTSDDAAEKIAAAGFDLGKGKKFKYGRGVYSTPNPAEAERFANEFKWEGKAFKAMLQNRVNMDTIVVPDGNNRGSEYFVTGNEENIRPYGILVKEM